MNIDKKTCINIGIVAFLLYLAIHYWDGLVGLFNLFLAAAGTLINGAIIAYVLNILMRFYERHMAPNTKKKVWNAMRRPVCMALAFLTLVAVIVALIQIILPQLISCVQVLLSSLPGVLRQMYDKLMENPTIAALMVDYNLVLPATEQEWREIIERAANLLFNGAGNVVNTAVSFTTSLVGSILSLLMSLIFTFNILIGKETLQRQSRNLLHRVLGDTRMARAMHIISTLDDCFHNYIVGQCTEAVILGTLCTIGMMLLRLDYALMLGTFVGMMALIPIIGPYIGAAVGCIMLFSISPAKSLELKHTIKLIRELTSEIDEIENEIKIIMDEIHSPILSIPGINYRMGAMILAEIGDFSRFDSPDKILAYAGMSPSTYQSGQLDNCYSHMEKRGSRYLRYALYNATKYVCHWDESFGAYLAKKRTEGKHYNVALSHAAKKLVRTIYAMEKSGRVYNKAA